MDSFRLLASDSLPAGCKLAYQLNIPDGVKTSAQGLLQIESIQQIDESRALVALTNFGVIPLSKYWKLIMFDKKNERILWDFPLIKKAHGNLNIFDFEKQNFDVTSTNIIVYSELNDTSEITSIDLNTGKIIWEFKPLSKIDYCFSKNMDYIYASFFDHKQWIIRKFATHDGSEQWTKTSPVNEEVTYLVPSLYAELGFVAKLNNQLICLDDKDGKFLWEKQMSDDILTCFSSEGLLWIGTEKEIITVNFENGEYTGKYSIRDKFITHAAFFNPYLLLVTKDSINKDYSLQCFQFHGQNPIWTLSLENVIRSSIYPDSGSIFFTTANKFYRINILSGKVEKNIDLPESLQFNSILNDIIKRTDNHNVIIARERGIAILSPDYSNLIYYMSIPCKENLGSYYTSLMIKEMNFALNPIKGYSSTTVQTINSNYNFSLAQLGNYQQKYTYQRTGQVLSSSSNASSSERITALNQRELAVMDKQALGLMGASLEYIVAVGHFASSISDLVEVLYLAKHKKEFDARTKAVTNYWKRSFVNIGLSQNDAIVQSFFIKPYGENYGIIDLKNKQYSILPIPQLTTSSFYQLNNRLFCFKVVKNQLTGYDITDIKKSSDSPWPQYLNREKINEIDRQFIEAALFDDPSIINKLLQTGANINAQDEIGHTALMHACMIGSPNLIKLLLKKGANPNLVDESGFQTKMFIALPPKYDSRLKQILPITKALDKASVKWNKESTKSKR